MRWPWKRWVLALLLPAVVTSASKPGAVTVWRLAEGSPFSVSGTAPRPLLVYQPPSEVRAQFAGKTLKLMAEYSAPHKPYRRENLALTPKGNGWTAGLAPRPEDVLIAFKVEAGDEFDDNSGSGYWMIRVTRDGKPARDALRQVARIVEAYDRREGTTDYEAALKQYDEEIRLYPDNPAAIHDRFRVLKEGDEGNADRYQEQAINWAKAILARPRSPDAVLTAIKVFLDDDLKLDLRAEANEGARRFLQLFRRHTGADSARWVLAEIAEYPGAREKATAFRKVADSSKDEVIRARARLAECNEWQDAGDIVALAECANSYVRSAPTSRFFSEGIIYAGEWARALAEAGNEAGTRAVVEESLKRILSSEFDLGYMWRLPVSRRVKKNYEYGRFLVSRAKLERRMEQVRKALATLTEAQRLFLEDPELAEIYREMSEIYEADSDFQNALVYARNAFERDPYDGEMERRLRAIWVKAKGSDRGLAEYQKTARKKVAGERAPDFRVLLMGGKTVTLAQLKGKIVVLNFWATWCGPCIKEMPALNALVDSYHDKGAREIFFLAVTNESEKRVNGFLKNQPFHYQIGVNGARVTESYQAFAYPTHIVVDGTGRTRYRQIGATEKIEEKLRAVVERLLDEERER